MARQEQIVNLIDILVSTYVDRLGMRAKLKMFESSISPGLGRAAFEFIAEEDFMSFDEYTRIKESLKLATDEDTRRYLNNHEAIKKFLLKYPWLRLTVDTQGNLRRIFFRNVSS